MSKILKIFFLIFFIFLSKAYAQNLEIGLGAGGTNTRSDVSNFNILNTRYAFNGFVRWNFTYAWVARLDYKYLLIAGLDKNNSSPIATARNYNEFHPTVHQISINAEYNFLDFRSAFKKVKLCPYITAGVGLFKLSQYEDQYGSTQGNFNFCIPFGLGLKYALTKNFNLGVNFETTKTFSDALDNLNSSAPKNIPQHFKGVDNATNDWYYYLGVNVSYTLYSINCPEFYDF